MEHHFSFVKWDGGIGVELFEVVVGDLSAGHSLRRSALRTRHVETPRPRCFGTDIKGCGLRRLFKFGFSRLKEVEVWHLWNTRLGGWLR